MNEVSSVLIGSPSPYEFGLHSEYSVKVKVDRSLSAHDRLNSTLVGNRILSGTSQRVELLPFNSNLPEQVELVFFPVQWYCGIPLIERKGRGLVQDIAAQFAYNAIDPNFADWHDNVDLWRGKNGQWEFVSFWKNSDEEYRRVAFGSYGESIRLFDNLLWACGIRLPSMGSRSLA